MLTEEDQRALLDLARRAIAYYLKKRSEPDLSELGMVFPEYLHEERAVFVTLMKKGVLRGCIGEIFPSRPLYRSVIHHAICSAFQDPRFPALKAKELVELEIDVSVLTVPRTIDSWKDIRIGIDGMVLKKHGRSAVFLPQVAREQGWDLPQTLSHLARKAGLKANDWQEGADFLVFQATVFGENCSL